jgi:type VI secretion system protein ImpJ
MKNLPVHWSEGMFLRPHHFQAADRFWTEQLDASERWDHPYNYGVRDLELSPAAIENFQVEVTSCSARMRDGTLISIEPNAGLDRVDLRKAFETRQAVKVFLAVPRLKIGAVNVSQDGPGVRSRYAARHQPQQDE